jgi:hypothetical protein
MRKNYAHIFNTDNFSNIFGPQGDNGNYNGNFEGHCKNLKTLIKPRTIFFIKRY